MQALQDIFSIWDGHKGLATALNEKQDTVYRWKRRKRIPDSAWARIIEAAAAKGQVVTVADLHAANRPRAARGRIHKTRAARRRGEPRVST